MNWLALALAVALAEEPDALRYRVEIPDYPGAVARSATASVLLEPPPPGTPYQLEEAPVPDGYLAEEGINALAAAPWHEAGITGKGVKLAVFDLQWYQADLQQDELGEVHTQDCEAHSACLLPMDTLRPEYSFEEGSHGVACAEVVRDIAPGVELYLVRVNGPTTLSNAAAWAVREKIDIVSMSLSFFNNSFYDGSGGVNAAVDQLRKGGVLLVNSAGNYATEHWDADFNDPDNDGDMDFPWGSSYLPVNYGAGGVSIYLSWDQFHSCGDTDFDLYLYDENGILRGRSEAIQERTADYCAPVERLSGTIAEGGWHYLKIVRRSGDPHVHLAVFAREGKVYEATPGSVADPASSISAFTVGAVRATGYLQNGPESFSSIGPTHGGVDKPDIAGPDGLSTFTYGNVGFYGTSASTPAIAATLALVMEAHPGWTAFDAADDLQANALTDRSVWSPYDGELGAGKARLPDVSPEEKGGCGSEAWILICLPLIFLRSPMRQSSDSN